MKTKNNLWWHKYNESLYYVISIRVNMTEFSIKHYKLAKQNMSRFQVNSMMLCL